MDASALSYAPVTGESLCDVKIAVDGKAEIPFVIHCKSHSPETERVDNIKANLKRDVIRFMDLPGLLMPRNEPVAIVAGGPSLKAHLPEIRKFKYVIAAGSSHDFLIANGIVPSFAVGADAKIETADYYTTPHKDTSYLIASMCHPKVFDALEGHKLAMWHFRGQVDEEVYQGEESITFGCMVTINCIHIALYLGFQHLHFFGLDCSMPQGDVTHAYPVDDAERAMIVEAQTVAEIGEKKTKFVTTTALIVQATQFFEVFKSPDGRYLKGYVYGDGLLAEMIRQSPPEMKTWLEAA